MKGVKPGQLPIVSQPGADPAGKPVVRVDEAVASATPARLDHDLATCRSESLDPSVFGLTAEQRVDRTRLNRCMERKGYAVRRVE